MNTEWSLDIFYKGFDDENFTKDFEKAKYAIEDYNNAVKAIDNTNPLKSMEDVIVVKEKIELLVSKLYQFCSLTQSTDTSNPNCATYINKLMQLLNNMTIAQTQFERFVASIDDIDSIIKDSDILKDYSFLLNSIKENSKHLLSDEVEDLADKLDITGGSSWADLQSYLTSRVKVDYKGDVTNLSAIRNIAYSPDATERKEAYEAELACYDKIKDSIAFALNNIKGQVNTMSKLRGFESPLMQALSKSRMKKETLDAMFAAIDESLPKFHAYLRRKGELLGHKNGLPWYDLFAPMGKLEKKYTLEEAKEYLLEHFRPFNPELADMIERAFDESWIDFYPHDGKVGGAFCSNIPYFKQSRVLTNYDGQLGDIVTLAHELGHAYHGQQIETHRILNQDYTMPVAETASTFNEVVIMNAAINEAEGEEKLALIESRLQDDTQIICDIYSRYFFESAVFAKREDSFMFADELEQMMLDSQKKAYGTGLDPEYLHPYMWVCKGHYYSSGLSFYNFPYAFGGLFARGLYARYLEEGSAFIPKYNALLHATTVSTVEDVAKMADIDLTDKSFWKQSLKTIEESIDKFLELTK